MATAYPANGAAPMGVVAIDAATQAVGPSNAANYTQITTSGTTVVKAGPGVFMGVVVTNTGTNMTVVVYDGTASSANIVLGTATAAALGSLTGGPAGVGVRCLTGITVVAGGTMGQINCLWD